MRRLVTSRSITWWRWMFCAKRISSWACAREMGTKENMTKTSSLHIQRAKAEKDSWDRLPPTLRHTSVERWTQCPIHQWNSRTTSTTLGRRQDIQLGRNWGSIGRNLRLSVETNTPWHTEVSHSTKKWGKAEVADHVAKMKKVRSYRTKIEAWDQNPTTEELPLKAEDNTNVNSAAREEAEIEKKVETGALTASIHPNLVQRNS